MQICSRNRTESDNIRCKVFMLFSSTLLLQKRDRNSFGNKSNNSRADLTSGTSSLHKHSDNDDLGKSLSTISLPMEEKLPSPRSKRRLARRAERVLSHLTPTRLHEMFTGVNSDEELVMALEHCAEVLVIHHRTIAQAFHSYQHLYIGSGNHDLTQGSVGLHTISLLTSGSCHHESHNAKSYGLNLDGWIQFLSDTAMLQTMAIEEVVEIWQQSSAPRGGPLDGGSFAEALVRLAWSQSRATSRPLVTKFDDVIKSVRDRIAGINGRDVAAMSVATHFHAAFKSSEVI